MNDFQQEFSPYLKPSEVKLNVWLYWENLGPKGMPAYLKLCIETLRKHNTGAVIHLVTPDNLKEYIPDLEIDLNSIRMKDAKKTAVSLKADYLRVKLLHAYGGLWQDVDCIALRNYSDEINRLLDQHDFVCMRKVSKENKYISNNFIASVKGGDVIGEYLSRMELHILYKYSNDEKYDWTEIGAAMLTPVVNAASEGSIFFFDEDLIHPFDFTEAKILQSVDPYYQFEAKLDPNALCVMLYHSLFDDFLKNAPRNIILQSEKILCQILRRSLGEVSYRPKSSSAHLNTARAREYKLSDIALVFTTFSRLECCANFLESIRQFWGDEISIYLAVQGDSHLKYFYKKMERRYKCTIFFVEDDAGLSASRNHLIANTVEPLIFLCDDDFIVNEFSRLDIALGMFNERPEIDILGGLVRNYYYSDLGHIDRKEFSAFNQNFLSGNLIKKDSCWMIPSEYKYANKEYFDYRHYIKKQDTVNNFCLIDRRVFSEVNIQWSDDIKIMGEHEDFYLKVETAGDSVGVFFTNALCVDHDRRPAKNFNGKRSRLDGQVIFMKKWKLAELMIIGKRFDTLGSDGVFSRMRHPKWLARIKGK